MYSFRLYAWVYIIYEKDKNRAKLSLIINLHEVVCSIIVENWNCCFLLVFLLQHSVQMDSTTSIILTAKESPTARATASFFRWQMIENLWIQCPKSIMAPISHKLETFLYHKHIYTPHACQYILLNEINLQVLKWVILIWCIVYFDISFTLIILCNFISMTI